MRVFGKLEEDELVDAKPNDWNAVVELDTSGTEVRVLHPRRQRRLQERCVGLTMLSLLPCSAVLFVQWLSARKSEQFNEVFAPSFESRRPPALSPSPPLRARPPPLRPVRPHCPPSAPSAPGTPLERINQRYRRSPFDSPWPVDGALPDAGLLVHCFDDHEDVSHRWRPRPGTDEVHNKLSSSLIFAAQCVSWGRDARSPDAPDSLPNGLTPFHNLFGGGCGFGGVIFRPGPTTSVLCGNEADCGGYCHPWCPALNASDEDGWEARPRRDETAHDGPVERPRCLVQTWGDCGGGRCCAVRGDTCYAMTAEASVCMLASAVAELNASHAPHTPPAPPAPPAPPRLCGFSWAPRDMHAYLRRATREKAAAARAGYNEFIVDGAHWDAHVPAAIEAFILGDAGRSHAPAARADFLLRFGHVAADVPLLALTNRIVGDPFDCVAGCG